MPDWASEGSKVEADTEGGIVPLTRDLREVDWLLAELRKFKVYRDALELLTWDMGDAQNAEGSEPGQTFETGVSMPGRWHFTYDSARYRYHLVGRRFDNFTIPIPGVGEGITSPPIPDPDLVRTDFQIAYGGITSSITGVVIWSTTRDSEDAIVSSDTMWYRGNDDIPPTSPDDWQEIDIPSEYHKIGGIVYDPEDLRWYVFGTDDDGVIKISGISNVITSTWEDYTVTDAAEETCPQFGAVTTGHKVVSNGTTIWRASNRFQPWRGLLVEDIMPGETEIVGLYRSDTDSVFVAMTATAVWTSPNGVQWSRTQAPEGTYTGAGCSLGGAAALVYFNGETYRLAIATNNFRDWQSIPCPVRRVDGENPVQQIYAADGRLALLSTHPDAKITRSLRP